MISNPFLVLPNIQLLLFLSLLLITFHTVIADDPFVWLVCSSKDSNFSTNSTYQSNLHRLLTKLPSVASPSGFSIIPEGQPPDQVFGLALCRGDVFPSQCKSYLSTAVDGIISRCPVGKTAAIWYDKCLVRYSSVNFSSVDDTAFRRILYNVGDISKPESFEGLYMALMGDLTQKAAYNSDRMFAVEKANYTSSVKLYGLVQCTRDLTGEECYQCLHLSLTQMLQCCWGKQGGAVLAYSCYLRFEIYTYYDESLAEPLLLSPPPSTSALSPKSEPVGDSGTTPATRKDGGSRDKRKILALVVIVPVGALMLLSACFLYMRRRRVPAPDAADVEKRNEESLLFNLDTIKVATDNFANRNKLGEGGFGWVYKGILPGGQEIAVKRLSINSRQGLIELRNEVVTVTRIQHKNLVRLLGFCLEENEKLLIYEFLPHQSLDKFLFNPNKCGQLNWGRRYKIIEGIARGLLYLHEESRLKIIHRDLKTGNILLDQFMNPKISDFGLAKLIDMEKTRGVASRIAGTNGYMAPEYVMYGHMSTKSDVFSFGVLVLEIITGRRVTEFHGSGHAANILSYIWKNWIKGRPLQTMDQRLGGRYHKNEAMRCIHIGLLCVQDDPKKRPTMSTVLLMLSSYSMNLPIPSSPAFLVQGSTTTENSTANEDGNCSKTKQSSRQKRKSRLVSANNVTITDMEPRLGEGLVYETVDGSNYFPHFYGPARSFSPLLLDFVAKVEKLELRGDFTRFRSLHESRKKLQSRSNSCKSNAVDILNGRWTSSIMISNPFLVLPNIQLLLFLSLLLITFHTVIADDPFVWLVCSSKDSNFSTNSTYQSNLHRLLTKLPSVASPSGFSIIPEGQPPDQVFGLALCRGDVFPSQCKSYLSTAVDGIISRCPVGKTAAIWYDKCLVRYSSVNFSSVDDTAFRRILYNVGDISKPESFEGLYMALMGDLTQKAAYNSDRMFAVEKANYTSSVKLYGLVQCTRDLTGEECYQCLHLSLTQMLQCCWGKQGGAVLAYSCYLRFEIYTYYDESLAEPLLLSPPPSTSALSPKSEPVGDSGTTPATRKDGGSRDKRKILALVVIVPVGALMLLSACFLYMRRRRVPAPDAADVEKRNEESLLFNLDTIKVATDNFANRNKLGEGGFGWVYKGILPGGQEIAVKRLSINSRQGLIELRNEVVTVTRIQHKNLVRLLGFCLEENEKLLIYEFLPHQSLDKFLFNPNKCGQLNWGRRYKIIEGIARGLLYLHEESRLKIIHRDLKTGNILLDQFMNPKISDFGLAKLIDMEKTRGVASRIAGTNGYMAPEYVMYGHMSTKSDVFSFGVLVLEIITGRRVTEFHGSGHAANILSYIWKNWIKGRPLQTMDQRLGGRYHKNEAMRCIHIGLLCVQDDPKKRPTMSTVLLMLSSYSMNLPIPSSPAFLVQGSTTTENSTANEDGNCSKTKQSSRQKRKSRLVSANNVTITDMEPR
ncbi:uncharacterized protein [Typha angustifolia]|uniref:uncharacterized protein n=1 Tax=Typha angustifolia TaxID=59011 RepID=UPI003C2ED898